MNSYLLSYCMTIAGLLGLMVYHPDPLMKLAIFFLTIANGIFLWK